MKKRYGKSKYAKMQQGGSVYDYMNSIGMDGSYKNRKAMFDDLFDGKYAGTAEQNIMLLRMLQNNEVPAMTREGAARRPAPRSTQNRRLGRNIITAEEEVPRATQNRRLGRNIVSADEIIPQAQGLNVMPSLTAGYNERVGNSIPRELPAEVPTNTRNRRLGRNIISADEVEVPRNTRNRRLGRTRLQAGGPMLDIDPKWLYDPNAPVPYSPQTSATGTSNSSLRTASNMMQTPGAPQDWRYANPYTDTNPQAEPDMDLWNTGMIMRGLTNVGAEIAGRVDRNRQNQYMQEQIANLGQQNPIPVGNYQPNRYALYARQGGKLQRGGLTRGLIPKPRYDFSVFTEPNATDSSIYNNDYNNMLRKDPIALKQYQSYLNYGVLLPHPADSVNKNRSIYAQQVNKTNAYEDAMNPDMLSDAQVAEELRRPLTMPKDLKRKKKGGWIQDAVNPEHKGYCTPMTKSTCTPRRKALARTFKKMAKNR